MQGEEGSPRGQSAGCWPYPGGGIHRDTMFDQHVCHLNVTFLCDQMKGSESTLERKSSSSAWSQERIPGDTERALRFASRTWLCTLQPVV